MVMISHLLIGKIMVRQITIVISALFILQGCATIKGLIGIECRIEASTAITRAAAFQVGKKVVSSDSQLSF